MTKSPCLQDMLCFPLYAASRKVINLYTPLLKPYGITYTQYLVLIVLWEQDAQTIGDLCRKLYLDSGTVTPLIKKMEKEGFVERRRCEDDERSVRVSLTQKGKELEEKLLDVPGQVAVQLHITPEDAAQMYRSLYSILEENKAGWTGLLYEWFVSASVAFMIRTAVSSYPEEPAAIVRSSFSVPLLDPFLADNVLHAYIMGFVRYILFFHPLIAQAHCNCAGLCKPAVVVAHAVPQPDACGIDAEAGNDGQIYLLRLTDCTVNRGFRDSVAAFTVF